MTKQLTIKIEALLTYQLLETMTRQYEIHAIAITEEKKEVRINFHFSNEHDECYVSSTYLEYDIEQLKVDIMDTAIRDRRIKKEWVSRLKRLKHRHLAKRIL